MSQAIVNFIIIFVVPMIVMGIAMIVMGDF